MEYQNITLSVPKEVLRRAKHLAIERGTSLSGLLTQLLLEYTLKEDEYQRARERHLSMLGKFDLGTEGNIVRSREELHAR
ncbi:MAG: CopG family transcriptional regulator [Thermoanaerobacteraceae bacterium]|nr:CopG family transcriptional regulator [Thermoanaerobacteraceae bacterium]